MYGQRVYYNATDGKVRAYNSKLRIIFVDLKKTFDLFHKFKEHTIMLYKFDFQFRR